MRKGFFLLVGLKWYAFENMSRCIEPPQHCVAFNLLCFQTWEAYALRRSTPTLQESNDGFVFYSFPFHLSALYFLYEVTAGCSEVSEFSSLQEIVGWMPLWNSKNTHRRFTPVSSYNEDIVVVKCQLNLRKWCDGSNDQVNNFYDELFWKETFEQTRENYSARRSGNHPRSAGNPRLLAFIVN